MSKLNAVIDDLIEAGDLLDKNIAKLQIKEVMLDTIVKAVESSNGDAADIVNKYRELVSEL